MQSPKNEEEEHKIEKRRENVKKFLESRKGTSSMKHAGDYLNRLE